ncbi:MAG: pyruvate kinase [Calditrichia bacterium]
MMNRTKIVATVGPASSDPAILEKLVAAGVDVFRLNFSHGDHQSHGEVINHIKEIRKKNNRAVAILQDLSGPKIRVGDMPGEPLSMNSGDEIVLDASRESNISEKRVAINYPQFAGDVHPGARLLLADGEIELKVQRVEDPRVFCKVITGGNLYAHKGVNFPSGSFKIPSLTEKDKDDLAFGMKMGVDLLAISFVRSAEDVKATRELMKKSNRQVPIIAKIEKHEALKQLDNIVNAADGLMVARGDLGVEIAIEKVPVVQKQIIRMANFARKPVITATQMLKSMMDAPKPTRAEATDVANAILDGTDAVMLSEETAVGKYPVTAVETMSRIAEETEKIFPFYSAMSGNEPTGDSTTRAVSHSAAILSEEIEAKLIFALTRSGYTANAIAAFHPRSYILALTPDENVYYRLALVWGVIPVRHQLQSDLQQILQEVVDIAKKRNLQKEGDRYVFTSGFTLGAPGSINQITTGKA